MNLYLDASALIPLFIAEERTQDSEKALPGHVLVVSDFAVAEFSAGVARIVRMGEITESDAAAVFANFDTWLVNVAHRESTAAADVLAAIALVRRLDLGLRTADAVNVAIAQRCEGRLLTFDEKMAGAARTLGMDVAG